MSADKLASFRIDSQLWEQFQNYAKENNSTATALLISYIKSVVNTGNVITSSQNINTSSAGVTPTLSIHDIDSRIDEKIKNINTPSIQNIEDLIDSRIGGSVQAGHIKDAIAHSYKSSVDQFNEMIGELQQQIGELKKQLEELQSIPPVVATNSPSAIDSPPAIDNSPAELEIPHNKQQIIRAVLSKKNIKVSSAQIRQAFYDAGWDGNNFDSIRKDIEKLLGGTR